MGVMQGALTSSYTNSSDASAQTIVPPSSIFSTWIGSISSDLTMGLSKHFLKMGTEPGIFSVQGRCFITELQPPFIFWLYLYLLNLELIVLINRKIRFNFAINWQFDINKVLTCETDLLMLNQ